MADLPSFDDLDAQQNAAPPAQDGALPSFDDMSAQQGADQSAPIDSDLPSFDDMFKVQSNPSSPVESAVRRGLIEAPVGAASGVGMAVGGGAGLAMGGPLGGAAGGLAGGLGAGFLAQKGEDWVIKKLGLDKGTGFLSTAQRIADEEINPKASFTGGVAGNIGPGFTVGAGKMLFQRGINALLQGLLEGGQEVYHGEDLDPAKIGISAAAGAAFPQQRGYLNKLESKFRPNGAAPTSPGEGPQTGPQTGPQNPDVNPDVKPDAPLDGDIMLPEKSSGDPDLDFARQQRDRIDDPNDPLYSFWDSHVKDGEARAATPDKGSPGIDVDATYGPHGDQNDFTYHDADRANDVTTVAKGIAADNPPAPQIAGAGNPVGAPMGTRIAARPSSPVRDYRKALPPPATQTQESTPLSTADIHEDVSLALSPPEKQSTFQQQTTQGNEPPVPTGLPQAPVNPNGNKPVLGMPQRPQGAPSMPGAPLERSNPLEMARQQRELQARAVDAVNTRNRGEDQEAPSGPLDVNRPARPQTQDVTAEVTPQDQRAISDAQTALRAAKMDTALDRFNAMAPKDQAAAAGKLVAELHKSGMLDSEVEKAIPGRKARVAENGAQYRDNADKARKEGSVAAIKQAVSAAPAKEFTLDPSAANKADIKAHATDMWNAATAGFGGKDPITAPDGYIPNLLKNREPEHNVIKLARTLAMNPKAPWKAYSDYVTSLADKGAPAERNVDAEIANKKVGDTNNTASEDDRPKSRPTHQEFLNEDQGESAVFTKQQNDLRNWLNGLSDKDHATIMKANPDLETDLAHTQDPEELMRNYMDDLADASGKRPGVLDHPAEDSKPAVRTPIRNAADLGRFGPTPVGFGKAKANEGKSLVKGSPEWKAMAEAALGSKTGQAPILEKGTPAYDAQKKLADSKVVQQEAVDGSDKGFLDTLHGFLGDESGAVPIPRILHWMIERLHDYWDPKAVDPIVQYGADLGHGFTSMRGRITEGKGKLLANVAAATKQTQPAYGKLYRAMENGTVDTLPQGLKDHYDQSVKPLMDQYGQKFDEYRTLMQQYKLPGHENLPERKNNGVGFNNFVPRLSKGQLWEDQGNFDQLSQAQKDSLMSGQASLSPFATTGQPRGYFAIRDSQGQRLVIVPGDGSDFTILRNGAPTKVSPGSNSFNPAEIGSTVKLKVKGVNDTWTVDHAGIDEIKLAAGKDQDGNWREEYHDNPLLTATHALYGLNNALERVRMYRDIVENPTFQANTATNKSLDPRIEAEGWIKPQLPQFDDTYMPKPMAYALDDFRKSGIPWEGKEGLDRAASAATKVFYTLGPAIHMKNEADKWVIGRGVNWLPMTGGWRSLAVNGQKALKSVWTQDGIQDEMRQAGMNPMYLHTAVTSFMPQVADQLGVEIKRNLPKWDPIAQNWGVSTADLLKGISRASTKGMWWVSDVLATQRYLEEKQLRGLSPEDAGNEAKKFIDDYTVPSTIAGSRTLRQILTDPGVSLFGAYNYGLLKTFASMTGDLVKRNKTPEQRIRAAGQMAVAAAMVTALYPLMSKGYQAVTGDKNSQVDPAGMSKVLRQGADIAQGKKSVYEAGRRIWTPSVPVDTAVRQLITGRDYADQEILPPLDYTKPANLKHLVGREADFLSGQVAGSIMNPLKELTKPGTVGQVAGKAARKLIESQIGTSTKSDAQVKRENKLPSILRQNEKRITKTPSGIFDELLKQF